jgi:hypothetical protein
VRGGWERQQVDAFLIGAPLGLGILLALRIIMVAMSHLSQWATNGINACPIILIYNPDQARPDEYAEIEFKTQADANAAVTYGNPDHI